MAKDPAFLFYPNDWLGGTIGMTFEEKGAYMELLMLQFNRGHMSLHMISATVNDLWELLKSKFIQDENGLWYNKRLDEEKTRRENYTESRRNNKKPNLRKQLSDDNDTTVYIIKDIDSGNIKIGSSVNVLNRLSTIKSRQNKNVHLIATADNCTLKDEKELHKHFIDYNIVGDWFNLDEKIVIKHMRLHMNKHVLIHMENENININIDNNRKGGVGEKHEVHASPRPIGFVISDPAVLFTEFINSHQWTTNILRSQYAKGLTEARLKTYFREYIELQRDKEAMNRDLFGYRSHFISWLKKELTTNGKCHPVPASSISVTGASKAIDERFGEVYGDK